MNRYRLFPILLIMAGGVGSASAQLLNGDSNFPIISELHWGQAMSDVQRLCERRNVSVSVMDSALVVVCPVLGFASRAELQFDQNRKGLKSVQAKFAQPGKAIADSVTAYFTRVLGREPVRTAKEKSLLIVTIRMEMSLWKSSSGLVNLVTATRGDSLFDASLVFFPPTIQSQSGGDR